MHGDNERRKDRLELSTTLSSRAVAMDCATVTVLSSREIPLRAVSLSSGCEGWTASDRTTATERERHSVSEGREQVRDTARDRESKK